MKICYVLLSPTFGMHQYTADFANRMAAAGYEVTLITTSHLPSGRYSPGVKIHTPISTISTGFSREGLNFKRIKSVTDCIARVAPDVIHFTGPHLWNISLVRQLRRLGFPVIHTIHDLFPHSGMRLGSLLGIWNRLIIRSADHILVHGKVYRQNLLQQRVPADKVSCTPLLHLFVGYEQERDLELRASDVERISYEPFALFFGRFEKYKGITDLLDAFAQMESQNNTENKLVLAGRGELSSFWTHDLPANTVVYNQLISDEAAVDLFQRCSLVVLPYTDATQSALVAAAYYFSKPVIVTRSGALAEYVIEGQTGFTVEAGHPLSLMHKLSEAFSSPRQLQKMGQAGRAWYEENRVQEFADIRKLYSLLNRFNL